MEESSAITESQLASTTNTKQKITLVFKALQLKICILALKEIKNGEYSAEDLFQTNENDDGKTILHYICALGENLQPEATNLVKALVTKAQKEDPQTFGINWVDFVNLKTNSNQTALDLALENNYYEVVKFLLQNGANLFSGETNEHDARGKIVDKLHTATCPEKRKTVPGPCLYLTKIATELQKETLNWSMFLRSFTPREEQTFCAYQRNLKDHNKTILHYFCSFKNVDPDVALWSLKIIAGTMNPKNCYQELWEGFINLQTLDTKQTPLHCAILSGKNEMIPFLMENGADPELRTNADKSALDIIEDFEVQKRNELMALVDSATITCQNIHTIKQALENQQWEKVACKIRSRATKTCDLYKSKTIENAETILHMICNISSEFGYYASGLLRELVMKMVPTSEFTSEWNNFVNLTTTNTCTALHYAIKNEHKDVIQYLVLNGADLFMKFKNKKGKEDYALKIMHDRLHLIWINLFDEGFKVVKDRDNPNNEYLWKVHSNYEVVAATERSSTSTLRSAEGHIETVARYSTNSNKNDEANTSAAQTSIFAKQTGTCNKKSSITAKPCPSTDKAGTSTDKAGTSTEKPDTFTEKPGTSTEKPGTSTKKPGIYNTKPGTSTENVGAFTKNASTSTEKATKHIKADSCPVGHVSIQFSEPELSLRYYYRQTTLLASVLQQKRIKRDPILSHPMAQILIFEKKHKLKQFIRFSIFYHVLFSLFALIYLACNSDSTHRIPLKGVNKTNADQRENGLEETDLNEADLNEADLNETVLNGTGLNGTCLFGPYFGYTKESGWNISIVFCLMVVFWFVTVCKEIRERKTSPSARFYWNQFENIGQIVLFIILFVSTLLRFLCQLWEVHYDTTNIIFRQFLFIFDHVGQGLAIILIQWQFTKSRRLGIYIHMLGLVFVKYSKFFLAFVPTVVTFLWLFYRLIPVEVNSFAGEWMPDINKPLAMMIGELTHNELFPKVELEPWLFSLVGKCVFFLYALLVTIALQNLLLGLTVSDLQKLRTKAQVNHLAAQLEVICMVERFISTKKMVKFFGYNYLNDTLVGGHIDNTANIYVPRTLEKSYMTLPKDIQRSVVQWSKELEEKEKAEEDKKKATEIAEEAAKNGKLLKTVCKHLEILELLLTSYSKHAEALTSLVNNHTEALESLVVRSNEHANILEQLQINALTLGFSDPDVE